MKHTILVVAALLLAPRAALHAQTVTLKPSDAGLRVEIAGQLFSDYVTKDTPRPFMYPLFGCGGKTNAGDPFQAENEMTHRSADTTHHNPPRCT
ncbi:MAG: hypothetical protein CK538_10770 [Opitutia bacterium]|nr:hypothetical protein [Pedosphaera sp.]PHX84672.1 MAG: hypothetical protein CK538_10770 [Opitutae bacterium]